MRKQSPKVSARNKVRAAKRARREVRLAKGQHKRYARPQRERIHNPFLGMVRPVWLSLGRAKSTLANRVNVRDEHGNITSKIISTSNNKYAARGR